MTAPGAPKAPTPIDPYRASGVDVDAGNRLVSRIGPLAAATSRAGSLGGVGGFGALFDPKAAGYRDPLLVAATDGVGTKLAIAGAVDRHDTIGIDLVAMCVNDLVVQGAEPLFFLDYLATSRLDVDRAEQVVVGIAEGCRRAGCALIGGETAEMPGLYAAGDYDLAGFAVGAVERTGVITGAGIAEGDVIVGLGSNGLHSNGFSLVRKLVADHRLDYAAPAPFDRTVALGDALLTPTRIYVRPLLRALAAHAGAVRGIAHITGGGLTENIPRILPRGLTAVLDAACWPVPPVFHWLFGIGDLAPDSLARTFNMGLGLIVVVDAAAASAVIETLREAGEAVHDVGRIVAAPEGTPLVRIGGAGEAWGR